MIVDCAVYEAGERLGLGGGRVDLDEAIAVAKRDEGAFVWIGLSSPSPDEFDDVAHRFDLHPLAVEDAVHARQRPKLEVYGSTVFLVVGAARYVDHEEVVQLSQFLIFLGDGFLITVRHGESTILADVRRDIVDAPDELKCGPIGVVHAIVDRVVDDYGVVLRFLYDDIAEVEQQVFSATRTNVAERIYKLKREVVEFRQAVLPLAEPIERLVERRVPHTLAVPAEYFRDVHDHVLRASDRLDALDALLTSVLSANQAEVGVRQNEDMRKISAWVAIVALPTLIAGIYGMNFDNLPELHWRYGYAFALGLMAACSTVLYVIFRRREWL